jgi:capsular exopolysaccharide synthesis family protein
MVTAEEQAKPSDGQENVVADLKRYLVVISKRKWWALVTFLFALSAALIFTKVREPVYRATAVILIDTSPPKVLAGIKEVVQLGGDSYAAQQDYCRTQLKIIEGTEVLSRVVQTLRLFDEAEFLEVESLDRITEEERQRRISEKIPEKVLRKKLKVSLVRDTNLIEVSVEDKNPWRAAQLANEIAYAYRDLNIEYRRAVLAEANSELQKMVERYRQQKEEADNKVLEFERQHTIGSFAVMKQALEDRVRMLFQRQGELLLRKSDLEARRKRIKELEKAGDAFSLPLEQILTSSLIISLKEQVMQLRNEKAALLTTLGEKHPRLQAIEEQLKLAQDSLKNEINAFLKQVEGDYKEVMDALAEVNSLMSKAEEELAKMAKLDLEYNALLEQKKSANEVYRFVSGRFAETSLSEQVETNNVRLQELARPPEKPVKPDFVLSVAVGGLLGVVLGIAFAFLVELLDNTVKSREEVEAILGAVCLGIVPSIPGANKSSGKTRSEDPHVAQRDFYVVQHPKSSVAEALNTLRTNLVFALPSKKIDSIVVSSPNPLEGKSTVTVALALTMARFGARTLIVDADLRRPRLHKTFNCTSDEGLSTVLIGKTSIDDAIVPTTFENLYLLPCGPVPPNPSDLLVTEKAKGIFLSLREKFDIVIIDSPPLIPVSDARILARYTDGILLVVKLGSTTREALVQVAREVSSVDARILGAVLNDLDIRRRRYYGYSYYGYYGKYPSYSYYHEDEGKPEEESDS